jgi:hypothetical protein
MFYEGLGRLLEHAGDALREDVRPYVGDERARTQLDAVAALCADIGAMWPALFDALRQETGVLERAVAGEGEGLDRYAGLLRRINAELDRLDPNRDRERVEEIRSALGAAAAIQQHVIDAAARDGSSVKRI